MILDFLKKQKRRMIFLRQYNSRKPGRILSLMEQTYSNLGDMAIGAAQKRFLEQHFPDREVFMYDSCYELLKPTYQKMIAPEDILILWGGGNFGSEYPEQEQMRRRIIEDFPNNRIISFPQTIYFEKTPEGQKELVLSQKVYSQHPDLYLIARGKASFETMQEAFPHNHILLMPDIVLSWQDEKPQKQRNGILVCLRSDREGILSEGQKQKLVRQCRRWGGVSITDMHGPAYITMERREREVDHKMDEFRRAKVAVTDRLHGMIFATVTGTPCVVLPNYNGKIQATYRWIESLPYIRLVQTPEEVEDAMEGLLLSPVHKYDVSLLKPHYDSLLQLFIK